MPFKKGDKNINRAGKPKGAKCKKTEAWAELGQSIVSIQAEQFNNYLLDLWSKKGTRQLAADLYLKTLSYFKPQLARTENTNKNDNVHTIKFNKDVGNLAGLASQGTNGDTPKEEEI